MGRYIPQCCQQCLQKLVIESDYGISRRWYWPLTAPIEIWIERRRRRRPVDVEGNRPTLRLESPPTTITDLTEQEATAHEGNLAIDVANASKRFGRKFAIKDIVLQAPRQEIFALLGPNGAGKSTLINCCLGLYRLTSGTVKISGFDIEKDQDQVYRHIGVCPQHEILWPDLTAKEHLLFYCRLKGIDKAKEHEVATKCLQEVELQSEQNKLSKDLSGGQKRRLGIAIALVAKPAVVFLDEPTTGLSFTNIIDCRA